MATMRLPRVAGLALAVGMIACLPRVAAAQSDAPVDTDAKVRTSIETMIKAIEDGNDPMRNRMFFELRIAGAASVPPLIELMKDSRTKVREYAIHTVSYIDDLRWIDPVLDVLQNDPEASTRAMACRAIARTQDTPVLAEAGRKAVPILIERLPKEEEVVAMDACHALGWFGDPSARPVLEQAAKSPSELVSFFAKEALEDLAHAEKMRAKGGAQ